MIEKTSSGNRISGFYRGVVKAHSNNGKCKIFWPGVMPEEYGDDENTNLLPDAEQAAPLFGGSIDGNGVFFYPNINSIVWGFFENEDINRPVYFASTLGFNENKEKYSELKKASEIEKNVKRICINDLTIAINTTDHSIDVSNGQGSIQLTHDGDITISGHTIKINASNIEMHGEDVSVYSDNITNTVSETIKSVSKKHLIFTNGAGTTIKGTWPLCGIRVP